MQTPTGIAKSVEEGEQLCLACGLCCKGVWFPHVKLKTTEVEAATLARFPLETVKGEVIFYQPCVKHEDGKCSAYGTWRPSACIDFRCELLNSFINDDVSLDDALAHVEVARGMADELQTEIRAAKGGLRGDEFVARLQGEGTATHPAAQAFPVKAKLSAVALNMYYTKYFKTRDKSDDK